jgi:dipeptidyl aminopeptidase/acylaminoacyl peptidase
MFGWFALTLAFLVVPGTLHADLAADTAEPATHRTLQAAKLAELIPVGDFFAARTSSWDYQVSPDGTKLAWIGAGDFWSTVFYRNIDEAHAHTVSTSRRIDHFVWAEDGRTLLTFWDDDGDENYHLVSVDTGEPQRAPRDLTPFGNVRVQLVETIRGDPSHVLIEHNDRDRSCFDLYRLDIRTGEQVLIAKNSGNVFRWTTDANGRLIARTRRLSEGGWIFEASQAGGWRGLVKGGIDEVLDVQGHTTDAAFVWALSNLHRDRVSLVRLDLTSGHEDVVADDPEVDILAVWIDRVSYRPVAAWSFPDYPKIRWFDETLRADVSSFAGTRPANVAVLGSDDAKQRVTLVIDTDRSAQTFVLLDRTTRSGSVLARSPIAAHSDELASSKPIFFRARDGLVIHGYLTLPLGTAGRDLPMVLAVHGGPWFRDFWGYHDMEQFLANRGYAVLTLNYRGSVGYGRAFTRAAVREFAGKMHDDLVDGVRWAVAQGIADRDKVAIFGGSYGGYATLVGMTITPQMFAAGIDCVGISDLVTLVEMVPPYWRQWLPLWHEYVGDPKNSVDRRDMARRSPIHFAERVQRPLLIEQGANDVRVIKDHSDRMVQALRKAGKDVDYIVFEDEGHHIEKWENKVLLAQRIEHFLARHLGGRAGAIEFYDTKDIATH